MPMATQMSEAGLSRHNGEFIRMASMDKNSLEKKGSPQLTNQITPRRHSPTIYVKSSLSEAENELLLRHIEQKTLVVAVQWNISSNECKLGIIPRVIVEE